MWTETDKKRARENYSVNIYESDCHPSRADDKSLPTSSHIVTYKIDGEVHYDIVIAGKMVTIFDFYWDNLRSDILKIEWTKGTVNPKVWGYVSPDQKKKK